mmetsp:Transcript_100754/g.288898  ORF Transcript_100754/g.288898 Transcript_100754/m.288898 type:complete len:267 (-) Transcript_100754:255-1055(-)
MSGRRAAHKRVRAVRVPAGGAAVLHATPTAHVAAAAAHCKSARGTRAHAGHAASARGESASKHLAAWCACAHAASCAHCTGAFACGRARPRYVFFGGAVRACAAVQLFGSSCARARGRGRAPPVACGGRGQSDRPPAHRPSSRAWGTAFPRLPGHRTTARPSIARGGCPQSTRSGAPQRQRSLRVWCCRPRSASVVAPAAAATRTLSTGPATRPPRHGEKPRNLKTLHYRDDINSKRPIYLSLSSIDLRRRAVAVLTVAAAAVLRV